MNLAKLETASLGRRNRLPCSSLLAAAGCRHCAAVSAHRKPPTTRSPLFLRMRGYVLAALSSSFAARPRARSAVATPLACPPPAQVAAAVAAHAAGVPVIHSYKTQVVRGIGRRVVALHCRPPLRSTPPLAAFPGRRAQLPRARDDRRRRLDGEDSPPAPTHGQGTRGHGVHGGQRSCLGSLLWSMGSRLGSQMHTLKAKAPTRPTPPLPRQRHCHAAGARRRAARLGRRRSAPPARGRQTQRGRRRRRRRPPPRRGAAARTKARSARWWGRRR